MSAPVNDFENIVRNGCMGSIESFSSVSEGIEADSVLISMDQICTPSKRSEFCQLEIGIDIIMWFDLWEGEDCQFGLSMSRWK